LEEDRLRLDKWLWYARFAKTRTAAQRLIVAGRVRINRERTDSPARLLRLGDVLTVALESGIRVVKITAFGERRGPPAEARLLFEDLAPPASAEPGAASAPPRSGPRPTKRDRRAIDSFANRRQPGKSFRDGGD
jgi:ribosome-associated heat shock protein Hsp15